MRSTLQRCAAALSLVLCAASPSAAQGFGLGARMSMVRTDVQSDDDAVRFWGGQIRAHISAKTALELSIDRRTDTNEAETVRLRNVPIQASLLVYPAAGAFSPYFLGGGGWYSQRVELLLADDVIESETTRKFGWHAGFGAELRLGRHAGVHGDYRYTFLHFGADDDEEDNGRGFLPNFDGSMWTAGVTVYF